MKEIVNLSMAGFAFRFDSEAYELLDSYLKKITDHYRNVPDGAEITSDIEARMAEIILSRQDTSDIVKKDLVESIISQMGTLEDISEGEPKKTENPEGSENPGRLESRLPQSERTKIPRRLYRNPDGAKIAGVCNGIAMYFNIDVIWVRLIFLSPLFLGMVNIAFDHPHLLKYANENLISLSFLTYAILWIIVPKARTPLQKIEMKGEKITAQNIERSIRETMDDVHDRINKKSERGASIFTEIVTIIGRIILFFIKLVIGVVLFVLGVAVVASVVALLIVVFSGASFIGIFPIVGILGVVVVLAAVVGIIIPAILIMYFLVRLIFSFRPSRWFVISMIILWFVFLIALCVTVVKNHDRIEAGEFFTKNNISWGKYHVPKSDYRDSGNEFEPLTSSDTLRLQGSALYIESLGKTNNMVTLISGAGKGEYPVIEVHDPKALYEMQGDTLVIRRNKHDSQKSHRIEYYIFLPDSISVIPGKDIKIRSKFED